VGLNLLLACLLVKGLMVENSSCKAKVLISSSLRHLFFHVTLLLSIEKERKWATHYEHSGIGPRYL
jgi:hypothetical protein